MLSNWNRLLILILRIFSVILYHSRQYLIWKIIKFLLYCKINLDRFETLRFSVINLIYNNLKLRQFTECTAKRHYIQGTLSIKAAFMPDID